VTAPGSTGLGVGDVPTAGTPEETVPKATGASATTATGDDLIPVGSEKRGDRTILLPLLALVGIAGLVLGPGLLLLERSGRGPQWLRR
jgi:hypothetical protein